MTDASSSHPLNAKSSICVIFVFVKSRAVTPVDENAELLIYVTVDGRKSIFLILGQLENIASLTIFKLFGKVTFEIGVFSNVFFPILVTD